jgi:hypothetical protein
VRRPRLRIGRRRARGQSLVEFSILVPAFMIILFGMLEFGFVFSHHLTIEYATREGARVGSALGNGTVQSPCTLTAGKPEPVDWVVIAAVQRVLTSPGSPVTLANVKNIHIYQADTSGNEINGKINVWVPGPDGKVVDGVALQFKPSGTQTYDACNRKKSPIGSADSLGVSLRYDYASITPLGVLLKSTGNQVTISDRTVMALNPFQDP